MGNPTNLQDHLIAQCRKGNQKAQYQLFSQYAKAMYNVAYRIVENGFDAEEVVQEAFIKAFSKLSGYKGESSFGSWLKRIVVNQAISVVRKRKIIYETLEDHHREEDTESFDLAEDTPIKLVLEAIQELPEGSRIVFNLKAVEEYKFQEIAEMLQLSESNCKVQYHRAKKLLRKKLKSTVYEN